MKPSYRKHIIIAGLSFYLLSGAPLPGADLGSANRLDGAGRIV